MSSIPDIKPGEDIDASHINRIKRAATRPHTGDGVFETQDFIVHRRTGGKPGGTQMRFVAAAGEIDEMPRKIGVYPVIRQGQDFSVALGSDGLPSEVEILNVWPHMKAQDFAPLFLRTGELDADGQPGPVDYDGTGKLSQGVTLCPAYFVDGEWWLHNTVRMSWRRPTAGRFASCGGALEPPNEGGAP